MRQTRTHTDTRTEEHRNTPTHTHTHSEMHGRHWWLGIRANLRKWQKQPDLDADLCHASLIFGYLRLHASKIIMSIIAPPLQSGLLVVEACWEWVRERVTHRQTNRETDRQTQLDRQTDRVRETDRHRVRETDRQTAVSLLSDLIFLPRPRLNHFLIGGPS